MFSLDLTVVFILIFVVYVKVDSIVSTGPISSLCPYKPNVVDSALYQLGVRGTVHHYMLGKAIYATGVLRVIHFWKEVKLFKLYYILSSH